MNLKRFTARTSRDALKLVRQELGDDAVVLSNKPVSDGFEVVAMAPDGLREIERLAGTLTATTATSAAAGAAKLPPATPATPAAAPPSAAASASRHAALAASFAERAAASGPGRAAEPKLVADASAGDSPARPAPVVASSVEEDVARLEMSTLSFQDYVRNRMLKRRQVALSSKSSRLAERGDAPRAEAMASTAASTTEPSDSPAALNAAQALLHSALRTAEAEAGSTLEQRMSERTGPGNSRAHVMLRDIVPSPEQIRIAPSFASDAPASHGTSTTSATPAEPARHAAFAAAAGPRHDPFDMINELRSMRGLIEERFGALAFMEKLQRQPAQARLTQKLLDCGFSPALTRKIGEGMAPDTVDETAWVTSVLERNLLTGEAESPLEDQGGVYALVGPTGVGKTTTTAKIAAAFATRYGAANLGLITLDAYRVGAHEQLRAYGRILGVPVHTAHDRASLEDLLELLAAKKMVLIDTAGMAQRDSRTRELLEMLSHRSIQKLLVLNAASQGETLEDVLIAYRTASCRGVVLSKLDEAVKLGPAIDALVRHKARVIGVANGQRVPEDWHRLSASALVQRALRGGGGSAYRLDSSDLNLIFAAPPAVDAAQSPATV